MKKEKDKNDEIEETKGFKKVSSDKGIKVKDAETSSEHSEDLDLLNYIEEPVPMGTTVVILDDTGTSAVRKYVNLTKGIRHSHEVIYDPRKKKSRTESDKGDSEQKK